jgi:hypothetical protein
LGVPRYVRWMVGAGNALTLAQAKARRVTFKSVVVSFFWCLCFVCARVCVCVTQLELKTIDTIVGRCVAQYAGAD